MRIWRKFAVKQIKCWKDSIETIVSVYNKNFDFKILFKSYILQEKIMAKEISSESVLQKRFDSMIAWKSGHPKLIVTTEFLKM